MNSVQKMAKQDMGQVRYHSNQVFVQNLHDVSVYQEWLRHQINQEFIQQGIVLLIMPMDMQLEKHIVIL